MNARWVSGARLLVKTLIVVLALVFASVADAANEKRVALVIGNGAYRVSPLKNPVNDAQAMDKALTDLGFDVMLVQDARLDTMVDAMRTFMRRSRTADVRLVYYAGHGMQVQGRNYLVPVDAVIGNMDDVTRNTADMNELLTQLASFKSGVNIVILDACRDNPFNGSAVVGPDGRVVRLRGRSIGGSGLARVDAPQGTLVAYATAPGSIAADSSAQQNSLYTKYLLENIREPALPVEQLFKRVRIAVARDTQGVQIPWESSSLMGDFCFREVPGKGCAGDDSSRPSPFGKLRPN